MPKPSKPASPRRSSLKGHPSPKRRKSTRSTAAGGSVASSDTTRPGHASEPCRTPASSGAGLNDRQRVFALGIVGGKTGKAAAIEAGYSAKTAESQASDLLRNPKVADYIQGLRASAETSATMTLAQLREWWSERVLDIEIPVRSRLRASELLGRSLGAFKDDAPPPEAPGSAFHVHLYLPNNGRE